MGNMKEPEVSGDVFPGSISFSNKGFEEPLFSSKDWFFFCVFWCVVLVAGLQQHLVWRMF